MSLLRVGLTCLLMAFPVGVYAQNAASSERALDRRHRVELGVGLLTEVSASNEVSAGGTTITSDADGLMGFLAYTYYFSGDAGVYVSVGYMDASVTTSAGVTGATVETASVVPLLFGVKYQPTKLALNDALRPFGSVSIGPYVGSASNVRAGTSTSVESYTETALGTRLAIGLDAFLGKLFTLGVTAGYHWVADFDNRIGSETNYSSPELSLSFGVILGG